MADHAQIIRIQGYLRESARAIYASLPLPPFTLFFHPTNPFKYFNYAIPDDACGGDLHGVLDEMRKSYHVRGRTARLEFFEAFAPDLPWALRSSGFIEEARQWSMLCTPSTLHPVPEVPGLAVSYLGPETSWKDARDFVTVQQRGFNPQAESEPASQDIQQTLDRLRTGSCQGLLGRIAGEPAGAAEFARPIHRVTEITGIATLPGFRRRGIAARLTYLALSAAFSAGVQTACLTAEDENAGRVYTRAGFSPFSIMLAYIDAN